MAAFQTASERNVFRDQVRFQPGGLVSLPTARAQSTACDAASMRFPKSPAEFRTLPRSRELSSLKRLPLLKKLGAPPIHARKPFQAR